jgi:transposase
MLFSENIGEYLSIYEVSLSQGELYTFVTNKNGRGKKGTLVASIKGTLSKDIIEVLEKLPLSSRKLVKEVTLDMARNMETAVKSCFPDADLVTDRFHVVKLAIDALQHVRVKLRWEEVDKENQAIQEAKNKGVKYITIALKNGDTPKQLLARCRYILVKKQSNWTENQIVRAEILFEQYPVLKQAYNHTMAFRNIYENKRLDTAKEQFESWINKSLNQNIKEFNTVANSLQYNLDNILNFFKNRNTNANAESFNSKIKLFRANLRGVTDTPFFLFRLQNLFA